MMTHVARDWYQSTTLGDGITLIHEIHVADWLRCNIWPFHGRNMDLIIDTGMGLRPLSEEYPYWSSRIFDPFPLIPKQRICHDDELAHYGRDRQFLALSR